MKNRDFEMIMVIVNNGYSSDVMEAAKKEGARGGTILHARGTANKEAEEFFNITIEPEKEIVLMLVQSKIKDNVLKRIYEDVGLNTQGQGIAFSVPVDSVLGINKEEPKKEIENKEIKE